MKKFKNIKICNGFSDKVIHSTEEKISWDSFWIFLFNKWKIWWMLAHEKSPALKSSLLCACSCFLSNMFKSMVISFVYLTNSLPNIGTKLCNFYICSVQSQHNTSKQLFTKHCSNVNVLFFNSWNREGTTPHESTGSD